MDIWQGQCGVLQIEDILVSDRQLAQELLYDMRQAEQQAAANAAAASEAAVSGPEAAPQVHGSVTSMATPANTAAAAVARAHLTRSHPDLRQHASPRQGTPARSQPLNQPCP